MNFMTKRLAQFGIGGLTALMLIGCSGSSDSGTETAAATTTTVDITGNWTGTWTSSKALADGQVPTNKIEGAYTQSGTTVSGTTNLYGVGGCFVLGAGLSSQYAKMTTSGTVQGKMISGAVTSTLSTATDKVFYSLEVVSATQMKGSYTISSSTKQKENCENSGGTFVLTKK
jgi:hypothetical protein